MKEPQSNIVIMGNQSSDLDSQVCTVCTAELLSRLYPEKNIIPLLNKTPHQSYLTPEVAALFRYSGYDTSRIVLRNSPEGKGFLRSGKTVFFLVDHNEPEKGIDPDKIAGIIDHHRDSGTKTNLPIRIIQESGSCASLISRFGRGKNIVPGRVESLLLAGAILVDTGNFNPHWGKTREVDIREFQFLQENLSDKDRRFLPTLLDIRNNLSHLNMQDHLRRDYKDIPLKKRRAGICSVPLDQESFFSDTFYSDSHLKNFLQEKSLELLVIMHTKKDPFSRQLSVYVTDKCKNQGCPREFLAEKILQLPELSCKISHPIKNTPSGWILFSRMATGCSRKIALPIFQSFIDNIELKK